MTTGDFDPDIPVGDVGGFQPLHRSGTAPNPLAEGDFDPGIPVGDLGAAQPLQAPRPLQRFSAAAADRAVADDFNPASPVRVPDGGQALTGVGPKPGGVTLRFVARLIDAILCVILTLVIGGGIFHLTNAAIEFVSLGAVAFAYAVVFEAALGWTPGKKLLGLGVHASYRADAPKPDITQCLVRNGFLLPLIIPYLGFLLAIYPSIVIAYSIARSPTKQGSHDLRADPDAQVMTELFHSIRYPRGSLKRAQSSGSVGTQVLRG